MLRSAADIIKALGETAAVAELLGLDVPVVSNWKGRKSIPPEYFVALSDALAKKKMVADPAVFRMREAAE